MVRKVIVSIVIIAAALAASVSFVSWLVWTKPKPPRADIGRHLVMIETVTLEPRDAREIIVGYGTVRADRKATLAAEVSASVIERVNDLESGQAVEFGQPLIRLDDRQYQQDLREAMALAQAADAALAQVRVEQRNLGPLLDLAEADLGVEQDELARVRGLLDRGAAPKTEYDAARLANQRALRARQELQNQIALLVPRRLRLEAEKSAAHARTQRAELNIERCEITAPFAGQVESLAVDVGDRVRIGSEILRMLSLDRVEVPVELAVSTRSRVSTGSGVVLVVESMSDVKWVGLIARIAPVADERSRTFEAYVDVDNRGESIPLLPGCFVRAEVDGPVMENALVVPRGAVVDGRVFVVNDGKAHARSVVVERYLHDQAVLSGEVSPGDRVVTTNLDILYDGALVREADIDGAGSNGAHLDDEGHKPSSAPAATGDGS